MPRGRRPKSREISWMPPVFSGRQESVRSPGFAVIVPVHHDAKARGHLRAARSSLLQKCITSILHAGAICREAIDEPCEVTVLVVDDYSPSQLAPLLRGFASEDVHLLPNRQIRGQGGAIGSAIAEVSAPVLAFTDSDCVVAPDWIVRMTLHYRRFPNHAGVAGPNWMFSTPRGRWSSYLTTQEAALMRFLFDSEIDYHRGITSRIDCRNMSLRSDAISASDL